MNTCYHLEFLHLVGNTKLSETRKAKQKRHKNVRTSAWLDLKNTWSSGGWLCCTAQLLIVAHLGRMRIFADEFVVVVNSGIPWPMAAATFLRRGKPRVDPSSDFLLWLQPEKEKDLPSKRSSFLCHSRSQNISPLFPRDPRNRKRFWIHKELPWIN